MGNSCFLSDLAAASGSFWCAKKNPKICEEFHKDSIVHAGAFFQSLPCLMS
eukprot:TRINITY_DN1683_c1_g1_i2.p5 TRINITY_DN1683_c1_g1~~TRINITY_DN1683_c1_g1_i2.p5  ORF type:complete len:51 (-),score=7.24 TRINITY_DN1683_c1_g1_i2:140-292(-)